MPTSAKPRKKYRPRARLVDPVGYVVEGLTPIANHESYLVDMKITNSQAMVALLNGSAKQRDMDILIAMSNICEALVQLGFGKEYEQVAIDGRYAILSIIFRAVDKLRFVPTGPEIKLLHDLMELHDAQMEVINVKDMEAALALAKRELRTKKAIKLPPLPEALKGITA